MVNPPIPKSLYTPSIGNLVRVLMLPCAQTPQVWAAAAVPAFIHAFGSAIRPDWKVAIEALTGDSWLHHVTGGMEDATELESPLGNFGMKAFHETAAFADVAFFVQWLAGLTDNFLHDWQSQILSMPECDPTAKAGQGYSTQPYLAIPGDGTYQSCFSWFVNSGKFSPATPPLVTVESEHPWFLACSATAQDSHGTPVGLSIRIRCQETNEILDEDSNNIDPSYYGWGPKVFFSSDGIKHPFDQTRTYIAEGSGISQTNINELFPTSGRLALGSW